VYGRGSPNGGVSIATFLGGSQVLGVVPKVLAKGDIIGKTIGEELQVPTMSNRLNAMFNHADAFIALPGGLLNVNGFYDNLLSFLDQAVEQKFLTSSARQIIISMLLLNN